jgi:hypothetical protein
VPSYDPQRNRPRARPHDDEPAPIDALLAAAVPQPAATPEVVAVAPRAEPRRGELPEHRHGDGCHHDHDHGPRRVGPLGVLAAAVFALVTLRALRRRRRRRSGEG